MPHLFHHERCGPAATITVSKEEQALIRDFEVFVVADSFDNLGPVSSQPRSKKGLQFTLAVILIDRRHVSQNLTPVDSSPVERRVRKYVDVVPAELLSELPVTPDSLFA